MLWIYSSCEPAFREAYRSKTTLLDIADDIQSGTVSSVCVAMDRDFDNFRHTIKSSPNIFYTFGYSWENDVWNEEIVESVFYELCPIDEDPTVRLEIERILEEFDLKTRWVIVGDVILSFHDKSLILRGSEGRLLNTKRGSKPIIDSKEVLNIINTIKSTKCFIR